MSQIEVLFNEQELFFNLALSAPGRLEVFAVGRQIVTMKSCTYSLLR